MKSPSACTRSVSTSDQYTSDQSSSMKRRIDQLVHEINKHSFKDELVKLMEEQLLDDATFVYVSDATS